MPLLKPKPQNSHSCCDEFGNLTALPLVREERIGGNFVRILIYEADNHFFFGYQIKIGPVIEQKTANIANKSFLRCEQAKEAAMDEITKLCNANKKSRNLFTEFTKLRYNQLDLFCEEAL